LRCVVSYEKTTRLWVTLCALPPPGTASCHCGSLYPPIYLSRLHQTPIHEPQLASGKQGTLRPAILIIILYLSPRPFHIVYSTHRLSSLFRSRSRNHPSRKHQQHQTLYTPMSNCNYVATRPAHTFLPLGTSSGSPIVCIPYLESFFYAHTNHVSFLDLLSQVFVLLFNPDHKSLFVAMFPHVVLVLLALVSSVCFLLWFLGSLFFSFHSFEQYCRSERANRALRKQKILGPAL